MKRKFYVMWAGTYTELFDSWPECQARMAEFPGSRCKGFATQEEAVAALRGNGKPDTSIIEAIGRRKSAFVNYEAIPEIITDAIAVDAACSKNPGPVEYRGVDIKSGAELFRVGPLPAGTNNIGEFLAIVHALGYLAQRGLTTMPIYSDSRTARAWVRNRAVKTTLTPTEENAKIRNLVERALTWLRTHTYTNPILTWETTQWGEIPADFGRK